MGGAIYESEAARIARQEQQRGRDLVARHQADELGLCRSCGRIHPCDESTEGQTLVARYAAAAAQVCSKPPYGGNRGRL